MHLPSAKKALVGASLVTGSLVLLGAKAPAFTQGPQYWGVDDDSGRFRHDGSPVVVGSPDCVSNTLAPYAVKVDLRVDVINKPDKSAGIKTILCGDSATIDNIYSSTNPDKYRGHFLQVKNHAIYGTLNAK